MRKRAPFHTGKPEASDVHLATRHFNAWHEELFGSAGFVGDPELSRKYIHRVAQLIRYVRREHLAWKRVRKP